MFALGVVHCVEGIREDNFRFNYFKTLPKQRMMDHVIKTATAGSQLACVQKCLVHDACKSCNFRTSGDHHKICELNSRGQLSQAHDPDLAHDEVFLFIYVKNVSVHAFVSVFFLWFYRSKYIALIAKFKRLTLAQTIRPVYWWWRRW